MEQGKLRFALFGNIYQGKKSASIQEVLSSINRHEAELYVDMEYYYLRELTTGDKGHTWWTSVSYYF